MSDTPRSVLERRLARWAMTTKSLDGQSLKRMTNAAMTWLGTHQAVVNALNVFPVPDGDTGTNMLLTMQSAYREVADSGETNIGNVAHAVAHGALMGARGNSGVILSQLWRGFARALDRQPTADAADLVRGLVEARDTAYKGVVRPVEGTILTVSKDVAAAAEAALAEGLDIWQILDRTVQAAAESVQRTPELLPILREAGVVDSGGKGLFFLLEGMLRHAQGLPLDKPTVGALPLAKLDHINASESIEPGQDYEVVVDFRPARPLVLQDFYGRLETIGTSIQVGEGDGVYRMHIHVPLDKRYEPIEYCMTLGTISNVHMENLMAQMEAIQATQSGSALKLAAVEPGQIAVVAVVPGPGLSRVFAGLGVAAIIPGGQTMNPSTRDILSSFENLPTDKIVILPNNGNVLLAARQAAELTTRRVAVVPSKTVPQGISAMLALVPNGGLDEVALAMTAAVGQVETGEVTTATRSVEIDGVAVSAGQVIGLHNDVLKVAGNAIDEVVFGLLRQMGAEDREIITFYYGEGVGPAEANALVDRVREAFPGQEVEVHDGGQPHYQYMISAE